MCILYERIKSKKNELGMTDAEFCRAIGSNSRNFLSDLESGKKSEIKSGYLAKAVRNKPSNRKLTDAINDYISSRSNILSPSTIRGYRIIQRRWDKQSPNITLGGLTDDYLQRHYNGLALSASPKTLANDLAFISSILATIAVRPSIRLPQRTETKRGYLTPTEIQTLCKACKGSKNEIPTLLGLSSLRISEICALTWDNIDMERRTITVSGARLYDEHNRLTAKSTTKNATSRRTIPIMSEQLYDALSAVEDKSGYVVSVRPNTISRRLRADCIRAGVREVSPHELRHSFASLAASLGVPERIAMAIGGWANDRTMKETYTHLYREDIAASENALADFFNNRETKKKS